MDLTGIFLATSLFILAIQDFKSRSVYWFFFPVIFIVLFISGLKDWTLEWIILLFCTNLCIILLQLTGVWLYLKITGKNTSEFLDRYLGLGDILFLIAISPGFIPVNFMFYITGITLSVLLIYVFLSLSGRKYNPQIPLAGFLSAALLLILSFETALNINLRYFDLQLFFI